MKTTPHVPQTETAPDAALARYRATGDPDALGRFYDATAPVLYRIALALLPDAASAEDVLQSTFLAALSHLHRFDAARPVTPWLVGILQRETLMARRRGRRVPDPRRLPQAPDLADAPAALAAGEDTARVRAAIETLAEPYRSVALLRWRYGLSPSEIAHVRAEPPGTTRSLLGRALKKLRRWLRAAPMGFLFGRAPRGLPAIREAVLRGVRDPRGAAAAPSLPRLRRGVPTAMAAAAIAFVASGVTLWIGFTTGLSSSACRSRGDVGSLPSSTSSSVVASIDNKALLARGVPAPGAPKPPPAPVAAESLEGVVTDERGRPVSGAIVYAVGADRGEPFVVGAALPASVTTATTAADGRFSVATPSHAPTFAVLATARGLGPAFAPSAAVRRPVSLVLDRTGSLAIRVVDASGKSVPGATVRAGVTVDLAVFDATATADAEGRCLLEGIPAAGLGFRPVDATERRVEVTAAGFAPTFLAALPDIRPGAVAEQEVVLTRGTSLVVNVVDAERRQPIVGAHVALVSDEGGQIARRGTSAMARSAFGGRLLAERETDAAGQCVLAHAPGEGYLPLASDVANGETGGTRIAEVIAWADGRAASVASIDAAKDGAQIDVSLALFACATVAGRCVDRAEHPIEGANVTWSRIVSLYRGALGQGPFRFPPPEAMTDASGRFRLEGVPAGTSTPVAVTIFASTPVAGETFDWTYGAAKRVSLSAKESRDVGDFVVAAPVGAARRVRILGPDDQPIWGAVVTVRSEVVRSDRDGIATVRCAWLEEDPKTVAERFVVRARGFASRIVDLDMTARADKNSTEANAVVRLDAPHTVRGRVTDARGYAVASAVVMVGDGRRPSAEALGDTPPPTMVWTEVVADLRPLGESRADADGRFEVTDLPEGVYHVRAVRPSVGGDGSRVAALASGVAADSNDVSLVLEDAGPEGDAVEGTIVDDASGEPAREFRVLLRSARGEHAAWRPVGRGRFRVENVMPGAWRLEARVPGFAPSDETPVVVRPGARPSVAEIRLERGVTARGRVRVEGGSMPNWPAINVLRDDGTMPFSDVKGVHDDGSFEATGVRPGRHRLALSTAGTWSPPDVFVTRTPVEIPSRGGDGHLDLVFVPAAFLALRLGDERLPLPVWARRSSTPEQVAFGDACRVTIVDAIGDEVAVVVGLARGAARNPDEIALAPGGYRVRLSVPGEPTREIRVTLAVGEHRVVDGAR